jgi:group I intron endonuclease
MLKLFLLRYDTIKNTMINNLKYNIPSNIQYNDQENNITSEIQYYDKENNIVLYDNDDFNLKDDLNNGQIYLIRNKKNKKCYIGQATCFTGSNNNRWGTIGRWKSHIREALKTNQDHCIALNNAIRKYGENNFEIFTLMKCLIEKLDENEIYFVKLLNTIQPNGYNIKFGGYSSKNNENTIEKMKNAHLGTRRNRYSRKYEEDNNLPKYIKARRIEDKLISYVVNKFPIGIEKTEYFKDTYFPISKYNSKEEALEKAIYFLNDLKEKYKYINEEIFKEKSNIKTVLTLQEKKEKDMNNKLPEYIHTIIKENKIKGYSVEGIKDNNNNIFPKKEFVENTNRWNLDKAKKYVEILNYINKNNVILKNIDIEELDINSVEKSFFGKYYLPKYFNVLKKKNIVIGFCINGFPDNKYKDGKFKKEFQIVNNKTLDIVYEEGIKYLKLLKN